MQSIIMLKIFKSTRMGVVVIKLYPFSRSQFGTKIGNLKCDILQITFE